MIRGGYVGRNPKTGDLQKLYKMVMSVFKRESWRHFALRGTIYGTKLIVNWLFW